MKIAPSRFGGNWTEYDWQMAKDQEDWSRMILIFKDRINFRYLSATKAILAVDEHYHPPRLGFSIVALDCLLIETLNQFYRDKRISIDARPKGQRVRTTATHRRSLDELGDDGWFYSTFFTDVSRYFRPFFMANPKAAVVFYEDIRCGILHSAETARKSLIRVKDHSKPEIPFQLIMGNVPKSPQNPDGQYEAGMILYRNRIHELVIKEIAYYCYQLRDEDNHQLRERFIYKMDDISRLREADE